MDVLLAVIDDLFQFARAAVFGVVVNTDAITPSLSGVTVAPALQTAGPKSRVTSHTSFPLISEHPSGTQYFIGEAQTDMYQDPVVSFDAALGRLVYGDMVQVIKLGGRWAHVRIAEKEGWILKDALRDKAADVFPLFVPEVFYDADNTETVKLRMCIADMFKGDASSSPLSDTEYVSYKLFKKGKQIPWGDYRPRLAGTWQTRLKGKPGIHIGIRPKNESIMEYIADDVGHLGFVEAVFPDESIKISGIGLQTEGTFSESMLSKDQWKELRPVFIQVL